MAVSDNLMDMLKMGASGAMASPFGAVGMGLGLASTIFGGVTAMQGAQKQYGISQQMVATEQQAEAQRKQMMELNARRQSMEVVRNQQRARSLALSNSTSQGAQFGSGVQGGYGQISGQSGTGLLGINQQLGAGENLFAINSQLMGLRQQYAAAGSQTYTGTAMAGMGQAIGGAMRQYGQPLGYIGQ